jgi:competence protein ComEC
VFKSGNEAVILTDIPPDDKTYSYAIQPGVDSMQVDHVIYCDMRHDTSTSFFAKRANLILFKNERIVLLNRRIQLHRLPQKLTVNYVYLCGNPHVNLSAINQNFEYKKLIIGADNNDKFIKSIATQADSTGTKYLLLKRNNSITIVSN